MADIEKQFAGKNSEQYNALRQAFRDCADDDGHEGYYKVYNWLDKVPQTSMVLLLVEKLNELGYEIKKSTNTPNTK